MGFFDDNAPTSDPGGGGFDERGNAIVPMGTSGGYSPQNPHPNAGQPVPGMTGYVYNVYGGIEPIDGTPDQPGETTNANGVLNLAPMTSGPSGDPYAGMDKQAKFRAIMKGLPSTPQNLQKMAPQLQAAGIKVLTNAEGVAGKIQFNDDGQIVDVIQSAGLGGQPDQEAWTWQTGSGGDSGNLTSPFEGQFSYADYTPPPAYNKELTLDRFAAEPEFDQTLALDRVAPKTYDQKLDLESRGNLEQFQAPSWQDIENDPDYQWALNQGIRGLDASKAKLGTLKGPGAQKEIVKFAQGNATQYGQNAYNRAANTFTMNADERARALEQDRAEQSGEATFNRDTFFTNEDNQARGTQANNDAATAEYTAALNKYGLNADTRYRTTSANNDAALAESGFNRDTSAAAASSSLDAWRANLEKQLAEFQSAYQVFTGNQDRAFDKQYKTTALMLPAVSQSTDATQNSANARANLSTGLGSSQANTAINTGNARAGGVVGRANAVNGALSDIGNAGAEAAAYTSRNPYARRSASSYSGAYRQQDIPALLAQSGGQ